MPYVEYDEVEASCSECGRLFRSQEALDAHRAESHEVEDATRAPSTAAPAAERRSTGKRSRRS